MLIVEPVAQVLAEPSKWQLTAQTAETIKGLLHKNVSNVDNEPAWLMQFNKVRPILANNFQMMLYEFWIVLHISGILGSYEISQDVLLMRYSYSHGLDHPGSALIL